MGLKLNTFVSLIIVSFGVALALGMPFDDIVKTIEQGLGGTLGHIALIFGLGAMLGKLIADSGGAQRIAFSFNPIIKSNNATIPIATINNGMITPPILPLFFAG